MKERRETLQKSVIYSVTPRGSIKTSKPSVVEMTIDHRFANRADDLNQDIEDGIKRDSGLIGLELVAVYAEDEDDDPIVLKKSVSSDPVSQDFLDSESEVGIEDSIELIIDDMANDLDEVLEDEEKTE